VCLSFSRFPEKDTQVLKYVGVDTYHELYFIICVLGVHLLVDMVNVKIHVCRV
jgi:hypothetical protein